MLNLKASAILRTIKVIYLTPAVFYGKIALGNKFAISYDADKMGNIYSIFPLRTSRRDNLKHKPYIQNLSRHPRFNALIKFLGPLKHQTPIWKYLNDAVLYAVVGQMLSGEAAASIIKRLIQKFGSSAEVIKWADKNYRRKGAVEGVSQRKRRALHEWAVYSKNKADISREWKVLPLSDYRREICGIWGFGRWSADMIAIFHLGRMDIWPENDTGIKRSCKAVFGFEDHKKI